jgi:hypothetical protein
MARMNATQGHAMQKAKKRVAIAELQNALDKVHDKTYTE